MSVEASEGKIQHQPIYSFTHSPARSGSLPPERSCFLALLCHSKETLSVYRDTWAFKFRGSGYIRVKRARRRGKHCSAADFSSLPIWIELRFFYTITGCKWLCKCKTCPPGEKKVLFEVEHKESKKADCIPSCKWLISVTKDSFKIPFSRPLLRKTSKTLRMTKKIPKNGTVKSPSDHIIETATWKCASTYKNNHRT